MGLDQLGERFRSLLEDVRAQRRSTDDARGLLQRTGVIDARGRLWLVDDTSNPASPTFLAGDSPETGVAPESASTFAPPGRPVMLTNAPRRREAVETGTGAPSASPPMTAYPRPEASPSPPLIPPAGPLGTGLDAMDMRTDSPPVEHEPPRGPSERRGEASAAHALAWLRARWRPLVIAAVAVVVLFAARSLLMGDSSESAATIPTVTEMTDTLSALGVDDTVVAGTPQPALSDTAATLRTNGWVWRPAGAATVAGGVAQATIEAIDGSGQIAASAIVSWIKDDGTWRVADWTELDPLLLAGPQPSP